MLITLDAKWKGVFIFVEEKIEAARRVMCGEEEQKRFEAEEWEIKKL